MEKKIIKVVVESYVIRNEEGVGLCRTSTREGAERQLDSFRECYERRRGQPSLPFKPSITQERAVVECEVVRKRYSKSCPNTIKAGKIFYKIYHNDDLVKELDHEPKPMDLINACAYDVNWTVIEQSAITPARSERGGHKP